MSSSDLPLASVQLEPEAPSEGKPPAVFGLHGRRSDERELLPVVRKLPDELHVICFRGPITTAGTDVDLSELDARDIFPWEHGGVGWYQPDLSPADTVKSQPRVEQLRRSLDSVSDSVTAAIAAFDLDTDRIGLLGFDQGAVVSLALVLEAPERYDWVVALNGYLPSSYATLEPDGIADTPIFVSAGENDPMVPAARSVAAVERLRELGADVTLHLDDSSHVVASDELRAVVAFVEDQLG